MTPYVVPQSDTQWLVTKIGALVRAWRIVLLVTAIISIIGIAGALLFRPGPVYTSTATLQLNAQMRGLLAAKGITVSPEIASSSGFYTISATDSDPNQARIKLEGVITGLASAWDASPNRRTELAKADVIKGAVLDLERLQRSLSENVKSSDPDFADRIKAAAEVYSQIAEYREKLLDIEGHGLRSEDVIAKPNLPTSDQRNMLRTLALVFAISFGAAVALVGVFHEMFPQLVAP